MIHRGAWVIGLVCFLAAAPMALGKAGVIRLNNGTTYEGDITQDPNNPRTIIVDVRGIKTRIDRGQIASLQYPESFAKTFQERLAKLPPGDAKGRLALAREAFSNHEYLLARQAAESARQADPNSAEAVAMLETIQGQMRLERAKQQQGATTSPASGTTQGAATTAPAGATTAPAAGAFDEKVLRPAEINAIRQAELRPEDVGVRYRFTRDVIRRFQRYENIPPSQWQSMTANQQIHDIITQGTPEMRRDVEILSDPPALFQFRRNIQPFVIQNCATTGCHSGPNAQKLRLVTPADSDAATYTNFYILDKYVKPASSAAGQDSNPFGHGDLRMIDRQKPQESLLLQYSLPGSVADHPHPDVANFKPAVRSTKDPRYQMVLNWIEQSLVPVEPDYGFDFTPTGPPIDRASTRPTTQEHSQG